jgi:hypothetical protein
MSAKTAMAYDANVTLEFTNMCVAISDCACIHSA